jgi:hypothetical protein
MSKDINAAGSADSTVKEPIVSDAMNNVKSLQAEIARLEGVIGSLQTINLELVEANNDLTASLEASEGVITEQIAQLELANKQAETGQIVVKDDEGCEYLVVGKQIPTSTLHIEIGSKTIASIDLHKHPLLIKLLLNIGSGFLQPLIAKN